MAKIGGGFDPGLGVTRLRDGDQEIGRINLPASRKIIPESALEQATELIYGKLTDSSILERFSGYLSPVPQRRELLSADVFFESLGAAADAMVAEAREKGEGPDGPLGRAAAELAGVLADRELCEMLRNLILKV
ncbi:MAG: hypothetical protein LBU23_06620 [Planctomycetota bacterium]|jgi:hypothetical protein|nr:hypothetical protein [Planctomycetota bacterium]